MSALEHHPKSNSVLNGLHERVKGPPWLLLAALLTFMLLASGCTVQPVLAGERPDMPVPVGDEQVIAIAPSVAPSGTSVAIAGAGWQANEVVYVNLEGVLDGVDLEATLVMTSTDADGRFETEFIVPLDIFWEGATDVLVAAYSLDKVRSASTAFSSISMYSEKPMDSICPLCPSPSSSPAPRISRSWVASAKPAPKSSSEAMASRRFWASGVMALGCGVSSQA